MKSVRSQRCTAEWQNSNPDFSSVRLQLSAQKTTQALSFFIPVLSILCEVVNLGSVSIKQYHHQSWGQWSQSIRYEGFQSALRRLGPCVAQGYHSARKYKVDRGDRRVAVRYVPGVSFGFGVPDTVVGQRVLCPAPPRERFY